MDTTAAALQANVTTATIRNWCRTNVVAAAKVAGRWIVDTASLARRITIGAMRTRKATVNAAELSAQCLDQYNANTTRLAALRRAASPRHRAYMNGRTSGRGIPAIDAYRALNDASTCWHRAASAYLNDSEAEQNWARHNHTEAIQLQATADALLAAL